MSSPNAGNLVVIEVDLDELLDRDLVDIKHALYYERHCKRYKDTSHLCLIARMARMLGYRLDSDNNRSLYGPQWGKE